MKKDLETPLFALQADQTYYLTNSETKEVGVLVFEWWHRDHNVGTAYEKIFFGSLGLITVSGLLSPAPS